MKLIVLLSWILCLIALHAEMVFAQRSTALARLMRGRAKRAS